MFEPVDIVARDRAVLSSMLPAMLMYKALVLAEQTKVIEVNPDNKEALHGEMQKHLAGLDTVGKVRVVNDARELANTVLKVDASHEMSRVLGVARLVVSLADSSRVDPESIACLTALGICTEADDGEPEYAEATDADTVYRQLISNLQLNAILTLT